MDHAVLDGRDRDPLEAGGGEPLLAVVLVGEEERGRPKPPEQRPDRADLVEPARERGRHAGREDRPEPDGEVDPVGLERRPVGRDGVGQVSCLAPILGRLRSGLGLERIPWEAPGSRRVEGTPIGVAQEVHPDVQLDRREP